MRHEGLGTPPPKPQGTLLHTRADCRRPTWSGRFDQSAVAFDYLFDSLTWPACSLATTSAPGTSGGPQCSRSPERCSRSPNSARTRTSIARTALLSSRVLKSLAPSSLKKASARAAALAQSRDGRLDPTLARFRLLRSFDPGHEPLLLAVREALEEPSGGGLTSQRLREIGRDRHDALFRVELQVDVDDVTTGHPGLLTNVGAHAKHVLAAPRRHAAPVRVTVDRSPDLGSSRAEALDHLGRHLDASGRLPARQDLRSEPHLRLLMTSAITTAPTELPDRRIRRRPGRR